MSRALEQIATEIIAVGLDADGATTRLAYSAEEREAQRLLAARFDSPPFKVETDAAGNLRIMLPGRRSDLPIVVTGSHLDSVPFGGRWDGALGVFTAAAALLTIADGPRPLRSIMLVAFAGEESPRFDQAAYRFGSRAIAGRVDAGDPARLCDRDGVTLADAMRLLGIDPDRVTDARLDRGCIHALLELHIDQGRTLADAGASVGAVSAITGSCRLRVRVTGRQDHSGAARMPDRRDALAAAAEMVVAVEAAALADPERVVATVGWIEARPGAVSVVPGGCDFTVDIRSVHSEAQDVARDRVLGEVARIAERRGVMANIDVIRDVAPVRMDAGVQALVLEVARELDLPQVSLPSHAGHDTGSFTELTRIGMVFVRNRSGRSHVAGEDIDWADAVDGERLLTEALRRLADESERTS